MTGVYKSIQQKSTEATVASTLCKLIGYDQMEALCAELGGSRLTIPVHPPKDARHNRIREEFDEMIRLPLTRREVYEELALRHRMSASAVRKILKSVQKVENQGLILPLASP